MVEKQVEDIKKKLLQVYGDLKEIIINNHKHIHKLSDITFEIDEAIEKLKEYNTIFNEADLLLEYNNLKALRDFEFKSKKVLVFRPINNTFISVGKNL